MLLVAPHVPGVTSTKPVILGFGCRARGDTIFCEALFVGRAAPDQVLRVELRERGRPPHELFVEWVEREPALYKDVSLFVTKEAHAKTQEQ